MGLSRPYNALGGEANDHRAEYITFFFFRVIDVSVFSCCMAGKAYALSY